MHQVKKVMWLYALSPIHAGSGEGMNYIDLPIQRERHTEFPGIEASSIKGALRCAVESSQGRAFKSQARMSGQPAAQGEEAKDSRDERKEQVDLILGKEGGNEFAALLISDAKLLFFPVKSAKGIFAWATCRLAIQRFLQDCNHMGISLACGTDWLPQDHSEALIAAEENELCFTIDNEHKDQKQTNHNDLKIMLEEYLFSCKASEPFKFFLEQLHPVLPETSFLKERLFSHTLLLPDEDFAYFVTHSTEVVTRIRIDATTKTANRQALFTEEYLPQESLLYSMLLFSHTRQTKAGSQGGQKQAGQPIELTAAQAAEKFDALLPENHIVQIGAGMSLGKGFIRIKGWNNRQEESLS